MQEKREQDIADLQIFPPFRRHGLLNIDSNDSISDTVLRMWSKYTILITVYDNIIKH